MPGLYFAPFNLFHGAESEEEVKGLIALRVAVYLSREELRQLPQEGRAEPFKARSRRGGELAISQGAHGWQCTPSRY